jgi:hypothetical protein
MTCDDIHRVSVLELCLGTIVGIFASFEDYTRPVSDIDWGSPTPPPYTPTATPIPGKETSVGRIRSVIGISARVEPAQS